MVHVSGLTPSDPLGLARTAILGGILSITQVLGRPPTLFSEPVGVEDPPSEALLPLRKGEQIAHGLDAHLGERIHHCGVEGDQVDEPAFPVAAVDGHEEAPADLLGLLLKRITTPTFFVRRAGARARGKVRWLSCSLVLLF